jgi:hypothetical protein
VDRHHLRDIAKTDVKSVGPKKYYRGRAVIDLHVQRESQRMGGRTPPAGKPVAAGTVGQAGQAGQGGELGDEAVPDDSAPADTRKAYWEHVTEIKKQEARIKTVKADEEEGLIRFAEDIDRDLGELMSRLGSAIDEVTKRCGTKAAAPLVAVLDGMEDYLRNHERQPADTGQPPEGGPSLEGAAAEPADAGAAPDHPDDAGVRPAGDTPDLGGTGGTGV